MASNKDVARVRFNLRDLIGETVLLQREGKTELVPVSALDGKFVALYFSAHWCPPCRKFTPQLIETYTALAGKGQQFEVIFVSSDRDTDQFSEYYKSMPWAAVPFGEVERRKGTASRFQVRSIPSLVVLGPDGSLVNPSARSAVASDPQGSQFPWQGSGNLVNGGEGLTMKTIVVVVAMVFWLAYRMFFAAEEG